MGMRSDHLEAGFGVDPDRARIGGIADHGDHLPVAARLTFGDQPLHQQEADAAPVDRRLQIDRVLHSETIGRPRAVRSGIGVSDHRALDQGDEIGKAPVNQRSKAPRHLGQVGWDQLERRSAVTHRVRVDLGYKGKIGLGGGPDIGC